MKTLFFFALVFLAVFPLFSQEEAVPEDESWAEAEIVQIENIHAEDDQSEDDQLYVISEFIFDIKGRTRPDALVYKGELSAGEYLKGTVELEKYIRDKTQLLINQRVLKENVEIQYSLGEQMEDGAYPVTVIIFAEDSWNIIALPRPAYSTNTGFDLTIKARDYNFLGTMNPLRVDLGYQYDENYRNSFHFEIDSTTPFNALGYTWNIKFVNLFSYRPQVEEPYYYQNVTGLSMELPFRNTTFTFGFEESVNLNEENDDRYKEEYGNFQTGVYMSSRFFTSWKIPTGFMVSRYGELTYNTTVSTVFNHGISDWPLDEIRKGPFMNFSHSLGFDKIDWHSNYREGISVSLNNAYSYDFFRLENNKDPLSMTLSLRGTGHFIVTHFFAISSRLQYRYWLYHDPDYYDKGGDVLRGIVDRTICADHMLSLNMDFPLRALLFTPSEWLRNGKLRFFDFELHISPVIDAALYHDPKEGVSFNLKNAAVSGGLEFIIFPAFMRSLYLRMGIAYNIRELLTERPFALPDGDKREIYLIMGHHY